MGVFKEEAKTFEDVAKKQKQIYNDSADFGYPYDVKNPPEEIKRLIESVKYLKDSDEKFPKETPFIRKREQNSHGVYIVIRIAWEIDEGYYCGTEYKMSFHALKNTFGLIDKSCNGFINIEISSYREKLNKENPSRLEI